MRFSFLFVCILLVGCGGRPSPGLAPSAPTRAEPEPSSSRPVASRPEPVVIPLTRSMLAPLLAPKMGKRYAENVAELYDGASVIDVELSADGHGRGLLVHRQRRTLFVAAGTPLRVGLTAGEAEHRKATPLAGLPSSVCTPGELVTWLTAHPEAVTAVSADSLPLSSLLGLFLIEPRPVQLAGTVTATERPGISRLDLTFDFLRVPVEFQATRSAAGTITVTALGKIDGEEWSAYVLRRLAEGRNR